jgi:hypothetical protein
VSKILPHIDDGILKRYYDGSLPSREMQDCEEHLAKFDTCRGGFAVIVLMDENISADEASILDEAEASLPGRAPVNIGPETAKPPLAWRERPIAKWPFIAASLLLSAGAIWLVPVTPRFRKLSANYNAPST